MLDTEGTLEQYRQLDAQVLLINGSETDPMFVDCAEALHALLPHSSVLRLPGLNHEADASKKLRNSGLRRNPDRCPSSESHSMRTTYWVGSSLQRVIS